MKLFFRVIFTFSLLFSTKFFAQDLLLSYLTIPKDLTQNANAVIRDYVLDVSINKIDEMVVRERKVITILNKVGHDRFFGAYAFYDNDTKVRKLHAKIYNRIGKEVKKYNKNKFEDVSAVDGGTLYSDSRVLYVEYTPTSYPYTLEFEQEYVTNTTGFVPSWNPISNYFLGVQKSSYQLTNNTSSKTRVKEKFFEGYNIEKSTNQNGFNYTVTNVKPVKFESGSLGLDNLTPELLVALNQFSLKGKQGYGDNWKDFGKWMYDQLLVGRDELSDLTKSKILKEVEGVDDSLEKAKIVYKYVQDKTRYISVQVGIGGWEPIAANQVDKVGYGDCKGLTNYTKALLDVVGVTSYYTVVYADDQKDIDNDFASMQGTHVILNIPYKGKDVWLECTSQITPFGYLGEFTDDRNVLVVTPEGGFIKRTQSYLNEDNLQETKATITLDSIGNLKADVVRDSYGIQYDNVYYLPKYSKKELYNYYKSERWSYNNNLEILNHQLKNDKDEVVLNEQLKVSIDGFATISNKELLIKTNVFNRNTYIPKRYRNRKLPLKISRGYKDVDEYTFTVPSTYTIVTLPSKKLLETKFGTYEASFTKIDDKTFVYRKSFLIKAGEHPKEDYEAYRKFRKSVAKYDNIRISLTKTN